MRSMRQPLDAERLGAARAVQPDDVEGAHDENRREERGENTGDESDGKALYRSSAILIEDGGGEDRRHVRVDDGWHGMPEAFVDCGADRLAALELLTDTLEDQHVRINRDTDGQHESSEAGQGEDGVEASEDSERVQYVKR